MALLPIYAPCGETGSAVTTSSTATPTDLNSVSSPADSRPRMAPAHHLADLGVDAARGDDVAGLARRRLARLDVDAGRAEDRVVQLAPGRTRRPHRVDVGSRRQPLRRRARAPATSSPPRPRRRRAPPRPPSRRRGRRTAGRRRRRSAGSTPGSRGTRGRDAAPPDGSAPGRRSRGSRAPTPRAAPGSFVATADTAAVRISVIEAAVHGDEGLAGLGPEEQDQRVVRGNALVARIEGDQLGAERAAVGRHQAEKATVLPDRHHDAHRLHDLAAREIGQRVRHGRDELVHPEERADRVLVEDQRHRSAHARQESRDLVASVPVRRSRAPSARRPYAAGGRLRSPRSRRTSATSPLNAAS